jgi:hypothetical protein
MVNARNVNRGDRIRFIAGKYAGKSGWKNDAEPADEKVTPVIVDLGRKGEYATVVWTCSIRVVGIVTDAPKCYADAAIQQCPDVEKSIVTATRQLAKCDIGRDEEGFGKLLLTELGKAKEWQDKKGSKALYRSIEYYGEQG